MTVLFGWLFRVLLSFYIQTRSHISLWILLVGWFEYDWELQVFVDWYLSFYCFGFLDFLSAYVFCNVLAQTQSILLCSSKFSTFVQSFVNNIQLTLAIWLKNISAQISRWWITDFWTGMDCPLPHINVIFFLSSLLVFGVDLLVKKAPIIIIKILMIQCLLFIGFEIFDFKFLLSLVPLFESLLHVAFILCPLLLLFLFESIRLILFNLNIRWGYFDLYVIEFVLFNKFIFGLPHSFVLCVY